MIVFHLAGKRYALRDHFHEAGYGTLLAAKVYASGLRLLDRRYTAYHPTSRAIKHKTRREPLVDLGRISHNQWIRKVSVDGTVEGFVSTHPCRDHRCPPLGKK